MLVGLEPGIYETGERPEFPYTPIVKVILTDMCGTIRENNSAARPVLPDLKYRSVFIVVGFLAFLCQDGSSLELNTHHSKL